MQNLSENLTKKSFRVQEEQQKVESLQQTINIMEGKLGEMRTVKQMNVAEIKSKERKL